MSSGSRKRAKNAWNRVDGGGLHLETLDVPPLRAQFFFGTEISFESGLEPTEDTGKIFQGCDFSFAQLSPNDLNRVALLSGNTCVFSTEQLELLGEAGNRFLSASKAIDRLVGLAPPNDKRSVYRRPAEKLGIGRAPNLMSDDHRDNKRTDLEDAPLIRTGGTSRYQTVHGRSEAVTDERILPPLTSKHSEQLAPRIEFLNHLADFVQSLGDCSRVPVQKMLKFMIEQGGDEIRVVLGLGSDLSHLPQDLLHLPPIQRKREGKEDTLNRSQNYYDAYITLVEDVKGETYFSRESHCPTKEYVDRRGNKKIPTYYAYLQELKGVLQDLAKRLYHYGRYLVTLMDDHGYRLPTVGEVGSGYKFTNFFHPNLPAQLKGRGEDKEAPTVVLNDVEFLEGPGSQILMLTGVNGGAGKTHFMDALARDISQAQSGNPCPGDVEVPTDGMFDHIFIMPNIRNTTGSGESGMESRARVVLQEFLEKVQKTTEPPSDEDHPVRVFIGLDEIMMGVTRPDDAMVIECNFLEALMTMEGVEVTIVSIAPDERVTYSMKNRFDRIQILAPAEEGPMCKLVSADEPAPCSAAHVLQEKDLGEFLEKKDWMTTESPAA